MVVKTKRSAYRRVASKSSKSERKKDQIMTKCFIIAGICLISLAGCAASIPSVQVTRFHLGQQIAPGGVAIEPSVGSDSKSLEFGTYAAAVGRQLSIIGLGQGTPLYTATLDYSRMTRAAEQARSPISIGIGGGTGGSGVGIGVGTSFGIGKPKARQIIATRLSVKIKRIADQSVVWEGRAQTEAPANAPAAQPGIAADKLAKALFNGFPGTSGETITVP
jgi:hypothetical protein